jgi:hypothetical protein
MNKEIDIPKELTTAKIEFELINIKLLPEYEGKEQSIVRLDASSIRLIDGVYYMWYTFCVLEDRFFTDEAKERDRQAGKIWFTEQWEHYWLRPNNTKLFCATSTDGVNWEEKGQVMPDAQDADFWGPGKHGPEVFIENGKCHMYFTFHMQFEYDRPGTDMYSNRKHIGLAVSDSPLGPFEYVGDKPVVATSEDPDDHDSMLIDDAVVVKHGGKYLLYVKGASSMQSKRAIGVYIADSPEGPFKRYENNPIFVGHTGCVWNYMGGVAAISDQKPDDICFRFSYDGLNFSRGADIDSISDPGICNVKGDPADGEFPKWGISQDYGIKGVYSYLKRFNIKLK